MSMSDFVVFARRGEEDDAAAATHAPVAANYAPTLIRTTGSRQYGLVTRGPEVD
jgi:hypothetical protein